MQAAELAGTIQSTEMFLLLGGAAVFVWWFMASDATQGLRDAISGALPVGESEIIYSPGDSAINSVGITYGSTSQGQPFSMQKSGTMTVSLGAGAVPATYGPNAPVPAAGGQTVAQLLAAGHSAVEIADLIIASETDPQNQLGGSSVSF